MHIYEAYLIEKIKKKRSYLISLRNPLAKYLIFLSLSFFSSSFFQRFTISSRTQNYKKLQKEKSTPS